MTAVPRLRDVCYTIRQAIETILVESDAPGTGRVYVGWPTSVEEVQKLGQPGAQGSVTIYPVKGAHNATRYPATPVAIVAPVNNLISTISANVVTFTGVGDKPYNIHGFFQGKLVDAYLGTTTGQTLAQIATAYAAAINALSVGVTATATGAAVTITGAQWAKVNIGSSGTYAIEEMRIKRTIMVSVWINNIDARWAIVDAILANLGTADNHFLTLSDGSSAFILYSTDSMDDTSESSYSMFVHHIYFDVEYGQILTGQGYQVEGFETITTINNGAPKTAHFG